MKKRILAAILTMTLICGLCACGTKNTSENTQSENADITVESQAEPESDEGETGELVKVEDLVNGSVKWEDVLNSPEMQDEILNDINKMYYFLEKNHQQYTEAGSADWTVGKLIVNGQTITMPCSKEELEALGYTTEYGENASYLYYTNGSGQQIEVSDMGDSENKKYRSISINSKYENSSTIEIEGIEFGMSIFECINILGNFYSLSTDPDIHLSYQLEDDSYIMKLAFDRRDNYKLYSVTLMAL